MRIDDCYQLGYISKTHGLQGEVSVVLDVDNPSDYQNLESVFVDLSKSEALIPFFVDTIDVKASRALVKFDDVDTIEQAQELVKASLYLPLTSLPELEEGKYYFHEIVGFNVIDQQQGELGVVKDVYTGGSQDLIALIYQGKEVLIPINDQLVPRVDKKEQTVHVDLPEGLLELGTSA
ncbi:ribosome maturation factor RimM [Tunicatimonas pelagia]|uniref:ribosome maturation factor RimM n=1 Tax=Tunicatimonas pelagia TaxID=931531 RepID=UPI002665DAA1|nr:ribosome maturation factor RimM [Tunicatimonas pelagia]WKN40582.1 ribosome maturation factor RimM [Tunicatimonas pelagia]